MTTTLRDLRGEPGPIGKILRVRREDRGRAPIEGITVVITVIMIGTTILPDLSGEPERIGKTLQVRREDRGRARIGDNAN